MKVWFKWRFELALSAFIVERVIHKSNLVSVSLSNVKQIQDFSYFESLTKIQENLESTFSFPILPE